MASAAEDIMALLDADSSYALGVGLSLHLSLMPETDDTPDRCVAVLDGAGFPPDHTLDRGHNWERPGVQILVRGARNDYRTGEDLARSIARGLDEHEPWTAADGTTVYKGCFLGSGPFFLGWDDKRRPVFSMNFNLQRTWS